MRPLILASFVLLVACDKAPIARAPETDPAVTDALADPIMADPGLALSQGRTGQVGVPVGVTPEGAEGLPTLGQIVRANRKGSFAGCGDQLAYGYGWSASLPVPITLPGDAKVIEAAGQDAARCNLRMVRYGVDAAPADALRYWQSIKGFSVTLADGVVTGRSGPTTFRAAAVAAPKGATVDLMIRSK